MKRTRTVLNLLMISLVAAWVVSGCENSAGTDSANDVSSRTQTINLDDTYGGYNTADESPAFDDAMLAADYGADSDVEVSDTTDDPAAVHDNLHAHRYLMITWGNLRADSLIDFPTDWSGSLCADNAVVVVRRTIRFDARDYLLPRTSRGCVEWVSHTQPHYDGILVSILPMRCDSMPTATAKDTLCTKPFSVTFTTGPLTVTLSERDLVDLHRVVTVDDAGNAVAFNTFIVKPGDCPGGFLAGQWKPVQDERIAGRFRGKWISENGVHMGYLRGVYGENHGGDHVFFGKWINDTGRFQGLLSGSYGTAPAASTTEADGWFKGIWYSRELRVAGELGGAWGTGTGATDGGFFRGTWRRHCPR
jgi:hypothetical protein